MDPYAPTAAEWDMIGNNITFLTLALLSALITGPSFLIAHAIIPSAVATRSIPEKFNKLRPIFYIVGFLGLASIITFFCLAAAALFNARSISSVLPPNASMNFL